MNFKKYIKLAVKALSGEKIQGEMVSFKEMKQSDLKKIVFSGLELRRLLGPAFAEYDYYLLEKISRNPNMSLGEVRDSFNSRLDLLLADAKSELEFRVELSPEEQVKLEKLNNQ